MTMTPNLAGTVPAIPPADLASIVLRTAPTADDVIAVRALVEGTGYFRADEVEVAVELVVERLEKGEECGYFFVFADEIDATGAAVLRGYACYDPIACTIGGYDLFWIAVDKSQQGRGLGRHLLSETETQVAAAGGRRIYAETSGKAQYASTRQFYLTCGYLQEAEFIDFYDVGDAKVVFGKAVFGDEVTIAVGR